jgi:biopolymer transport protein TolR
MGISVGGSGGAMSEINVTPMIDVILVLLIIFMVITPVVQMGYLVRVPPKAPPLPAGAQPPDQIILRYM